MGESRDAASSQQAVGGIGGEAAGKEGLLHVVGKGDGDDRLADGLDGGGEVQSRMKARSPRKASRMQA